MPTIIGHHDVKDTKHWLASPKREEVFGPLGVTNIRTFVDPQNPTRVAVLMDVPDMDRLMAAMKSEAMAAAIPGAKLVTIPGAGHLAPMERPKAVAGALAEFFSAALAG